MAPSTLLRFLLAHDAWATTLLLERCGALPPDEWRRPVGPGSGSLERLLARRIDRTWAVADAFRGLPYEPRADFEGGAFTPLELQDQARAAHANLTAAVLAHAQEHGLDAPLAFPADSGDRLPAHVLLAEVLEHGTRQRTGCLQVLERLGRRGDLELDPLRFARSTPGDPSSRP